MVGVLTLIYTFEGGIAAVIWTDLIQFVIYIGGSLLAAYELVHLMPGGWHAIVAAAREPASCRSARSRWDLTVPFTFWAGVIGGTFLTNASHGTDQLLVQRLLTCRNLRDSQKAIVTSGFIVLLSSCCSSASASCCYVYYQHVPRPAITTNDEIFPAFIVTTLPHGISGLVIAAIFAAAMSNLSGSLNSLASTTVIDFYQPLTRRPHPGRTPAGALRVVYRDLGNRPHCHRGRLPAGGVRCSPPA